ncbi:MAG: HU family DNA-binding protein [Desulfobacterales bacterium]|nr:HU family DNA-binding protein [Desulfobacterales bacterium]
MNRQDLIDSIASDNNLTKEQAHGALDTVLNEIMKAIDTGETVTLVGFGTLKEIYRSPRKGRNPQTGKEIYIPGSRTAKFVISKKFKALLNAPPIT